MSRSPERNLLALETLSPAEIEVYLDQAAAFRQVFDRPLRKLPTLRGKTVVTLFYEASTRTRSSFELAGKWMSADVINISASASSVTKGESLADTAQTLAALGADAVVIRHPSAGAADLVAREIDAAVINAGDGAHEHPTQGLLDLFTISRRKGRIKGLHVGIVGDIAHSRVARSAIWGLTKLGARVSCIGPATLLPQGLDALGVASRTDFDAVLPDLDVIMMLRIQLERKAGGGLPSLAEYSRRYGLDDNRLARAQPDVLVMHPGPANLGVEITAAVKASAPSAVDEQVTNGVAVRMAALYLLIGAATERDEGAARARIGGVPDDLHA